MNWFAAHAVYVFEVRKGRTSPLTVMENVLLVRGRSAKAALAAATLVARREEADDPSLTIGGKPARQRFLGIRKLVSCAADPFDKSSTDGLVSEIRAGTEATYLKYRVPNRTALKKLMAGKEIGAVIEE